MARISLSELRTRASTVDRVKLDATTEADIEAQRAQDGDANLEVPPTARAVEPPKALRVRLGMTQPEMASALNVPLGTWRNWEQGRVNLEPAAAALLRIVSHDPMAALSALGEPEEEDNSSFLEARDLPRVVKSRLSDFPGVVVVTRSRKNFTGKKVSKKSSAFEKFRPIRASETIPRGHKPKSA